MSYLLEHTADSIDEKAVRKLIKKGGQMPSLMKSSKQSEAATLKQTRQKKLELALGHLEYLRRYDYPDRSGTLCPYQTLL